ncbi:aminoacyl-tRNA hydrolase [Bdellovibrionota bacterium FG-2]
MKVIAGLGNPGQQYETTRHNVGFLAIDYLAEEWRAQGPQTSFSGEVYQVQIAGEKVLLLKPQTFMNRSGQSVAPLLNFYKCEPQDLIVLHDDVDLEPLALRIKQGGGHGGHNGLRSIDASVGGEKTNYYRVRLGVGRPNFPGSRAGAVADYVLAPFSDQELRDLDPLFEDVRKVCELLIQGDLKTAQNKFHRKPKTELKE